MRKNRRIVLGIKEEEMLLALACVFLKHGAEPGRTGTDIRSGIP